MSAYVIDKIDISKIDPNDIKTIVKPKLKELKKKFSCSLKEAKG